MVDFDSFLSWAEDRFDGEVVVNGEEIRINSIFTEDQKYHLWCNPSGGKHTREDGCYRCFYTEEIGTLAGLIMLVDGCTYGEAKKILNGSTSRKLADMEERVHKFFEEKYLTKKQEIESKSFLTLPPHTFRISEMLKSDLHKAEAEDYLLKRCLPIHNLMYCVEGDYRNRIVIPYYNREGSLIYWNTRHVGSSKLRYWGPHKSVGVGKSDVLYLPEWPKLGEKLYLTEGEFDALTLWACGLFAVACGGKFLSEKQLLMLQGYKVCLALDQDSAGFGGLVKMGQSLVSSGIETSFIRPPIGFKDWNKLLTSFNNENLIKAYIKKGEKPFNAWTSGELVVNKL